MFVKLFGLSFENAMVHCFVFSKILNLKSVLVLLLHYYACDKLVPIFELRLKKKKFDIIRNILLIVHIYYSEAGLKMYT